VEEKENDEIIERGNEEVSESVCIYRMISGY
jgi:hypothetical protein